MLNLTSCRQLNCDWPFDDVMSIEEVLCQLDVSLHGCCSRYFRHDNFHTIGIGTSKRVQERAGRLGLALAALLSRNVRANCMQLVGSELQEEFNQLRQSVVTTLSGRPAGVHENLPQRRATTSHCSDRSRKSDFLVSGFWTWWSGDYLLVLCEDQTAAVFSEAKTYCQSLTSMDSGEWSQWLQEHEPEKFSDLQRSLDAAGLLGLFHAGVYTWKNYRVVLATRLGNRSQLQTSSQFLGYAVLVPSTEFLLVTVRSSSA